jgi:hypothetical protein
MTSPVDTTVKHFHSGMPNAPVYNAVAGALNALLDACLKDGFNSVTLVSLVVASDVATATYTGTHAALPDAVVLISGVTGGPTGFAGLNGEQKIVSKPGATSITFATTGIADGTATGTIAMKMAPAGWSKIFTGTNLAAYQSNDVASSKFVLRVDDTGTTFARVVGYESMSDINTGVGPFPTPAQLSGGGYWSKGTVANSTAIPWSLVSDGRIFYFSCQPGFASSANDKIGVTRAFGDPIALRPGGDPYSCILNASDNAAVASQALGGLGSGADTNAVTYSPRSYTGLGGGTQGGIYAFCAMGTSNQVSGLTGGATGFPSAVDGGLWLSPKYSNAAAGNVTPRAIIPGVFHSPQSLLYDNFAMNDKIPGSGSLAGRNLLAATCGNTTFTSASSNANTGIVFIDITGPWR